MDIHTATEVAYKNGFNAALSTATVEQLAENYGPLDLLTAYIMRTVHISEDHAQDYVYKFDEILERGLEEMLENEEETL